jgi:glycosyltransferase involved in cell wall biosynthesis
MNILHTEWSDGWGGQEQRIFTEMLGMRRRGHQVWLAARPTCAIARRATEAEIPVLHVPFKGKAHLPSILQLARFIRRERIDIVNTHSGLDSWVGAFAAKLAGARLVRTRHLNLPLHRTWYNFVHFLPDRLVTCGLAMRDKLVDQHGFPAAQVSSIPTGIDFDTFRPQRSRPEMRAELGLGESAFVVLMVAVIRRVKRHEVAIRAFAEFRRQRPDAVLLLCGEGPMQAAMQALCAELGVADHVRFLGHRNDVPDVMRAADVLLLTSESEGVPQAVTQGLGLGLPVVATRVGGVPELVHDGETGLLVPAERPDAVAAALARLADDEVLARRLGDQGRHHALTHYSLNAMLDATEQLYRTLLESPR